MAKNRPTPASDENAPTQERSVEEALAESNADDAIASLEKNKTLIVGAIILATVAVCGFLVMKQVNAAKHSDASKAFSAAQTSRDPAALDKVAADFPGSLSAGNAMLTKADIQLDRKESADAKATFEAFVKDFQSHPRLAQGLFAIANIEHVAGNADAAKSYYEKTLEAQPDGDLSPLARIRLGDLALEGGDAEKAELLYLESISKHAGNPFVDKATQKIELAKIGNPPVVDRPEPKPEPKKPAVDKTPPVIKDDPAPAKKPAAAPVPAPAAKGNNKGKAPAPAPAPATAPAPAPGEPAAVPSTRTK